MKQLFNFAVDVIATYRLTKLLMEDKITEDLREAIFEKFPRDSKMGYFLTCPWCVSIWTGFAVFALRKVNSDGADIVSGILAASALTGVAYTKGL